MAATVSSAAIPTQACDVSDQPAPFDGNTRKRNHENCEKGGSQPTSRPRLQQDEPEQQQHRSNEYLEGRVRKLKARLYDREERVDGLKKEREAWEKEKRKLQRALESCRAAAKVPKSTEKSPSIKSVQPDKNPQELLRQRVIALEREKATITQRCEEATNDYAAHSEHLLNALEEETASKATLQARCVELEAERDQLRTDLARHQDKVDISADAGAEVQDRARVEQPREESSEAASSAPIAQGAPSLTSPVEVERLKAVVQTLSKAWYELDQEKRQSAVREREVAEAHSAEMARLMSALRERGEHMRTLEVRIQQLQQQ